MRIGIRYAARSDVGMLREGNEDSAYAGTRLLAVADGMGGHVGGEIASAAAIDTLRLLDTDVPVAELLAALEHSVKQANDKLQRMVEGDPALQGMGTTLTAMLWSGSHIALVHIGDSRAYLLRGGELFQITHDHTLVQSLVDEGRISLDEAAVHPQRSLLLRALDGRGEVDPDLSLREATVGDRYLLCSDGLSGVVSAETIHQVLTTIPEPEQAVRQLIDLANRGGGPDNITCVVADVIDLDQQQPAGGARPVLAGAAANSSGPPEPPGISPGMAQDTPAQRAKQLGDTMPQPPIVVDELPPPAPAPMAAPHPPGAHPHMAPGPAVVPARKRWTWLIVMVGVFVILMAGGVFAGVSYLRSGYYIADDKGQVALFEGQPEGVLGLSMSKKAKSKDQPSPPILLADLPNDRRAAVQRKIMVDEGGLGGAQQAINSLRSAQCKWSVAAEGDQVFIFQGRGQNSCQLKRDAGSEKQLKVSELPRTTQEQVRQGIPAETRQAADAVYKDLVTARDTCKTNRAADCPPEKP